MNQENGIRSENIVIIEFIATLKGKRKIIFMVTGLCIIISAIYSLLAQPYFKSYISVYPVSQDTSLQQPLNDLQGIASVFGYNMGGGGAFYYIPDVVDSRQLRTELILREWTAAGYDQPINLIKLLKVDQPKKYLPGYWLGKLLPKTGSKGQRNLDSALKKLSKLISVQEEESGLIKVSVLMPDPQLAADVVNYVSVYIREYIASEVNKQSTDYRQFIGGQLEQAMADLTSAEESLTEFRKANPIVMDTPDLQQTRARMIRRVAVNQEIYITLRQQYELAKLEEQKDALVINVLDAGAVPSKKSRPRRSLIVILAALAGFFGSTYFLILNRHYRKLSVEI